MKSVGLINSKEENLRHLRNLRDQTPAQIGLQEKKIPKEVHIPPYLKEILRPVRLGTLVVNTGKIIGASLIVSVSLLV